MPTTAEVIPIARICQFLAADDQQQQTLLKGRFLRGELSGDIDMTRNSVEWLNAVNSSSTLLPVLTNYLYWKCMPYIGRAKYILNQGGSGQIVNPATGVASSIQEVFYQSTVGLPGTPTLINGQLSFVITDDFILNNSLQVTIDNGVIPFGVYTDRLSFTASYTNTDVTINIFNGGEEPPDNIGLQDGWVVQIRGLKFVTI